MPQSDVIEILVVLELYALWRSRTGLTLVFEKGKPAWRHFLDGFSYVSTLVEARELDLMHDWKTMENNLKRATRKGRIKRF